MKTINNYKIKPYANLRGADLRGATLFGANLHDANLHDANLRGADLRGATLFGANLHDANLHDANLRGATLFGADLRGATLFGANLRGADLRGADLRGATLFGANLHDANLHDANLRGATLFGATLFGAKNISDTVAAALQVLPDEGDVIGWKKCGNNVIVKLLITDGTPRSSATTRKCRAKSVFVLEIFGAEFGVSKHDGVTVYTKGETVECDNWCEDRWAECAGGIHFFITRKEAEDY